MDQQKSEKSNEGENRIVILSIFVLKLLSDSLMILTVADPEICPSGGPMTSKNCGPARQPSFFWHVLTGGGAVDVLPSPVIS